MLITLIIAIFGAARALSSIGYKEFPNLQDPCNGTSLPIGKHINFTAAPFYFSPIMNYFSASMNAMSASCQRLIHSVARGGREELTVAVFGTSIDYGSSCNSDVYRNFSQFSLIPKPHEQTCAPDYLDNWDSSASWCPWSGRILSYMKSKYKKSEVKLFNYAVGGGRITTALKKLRELRAGKFPLYHNRNPDLIFVNTIYNDGDLTNLALNQTLERFLREALSISPPPAILMIISAQSARQDIYKEICAFYNVAYVEMGKDLKSINDIVYNNTDQHSNSSYTLAKFIFNDGGHYSYVGHELIAQYLITWLEWVEASNPSLLLPNPRYIDPTIIHCGSYYPVETDGTPLYILRDNTSCNGSYWKLIYERHKRGFISTTPFSCAEFPIQSCKTQSNFVSLELLHSYENAGIGRAYISRKNGSVLASIDFDTRWDHHYSLPKNVDLLFNLSSGESETDLNIRIVVLSSPDRIVNKVKVLSVSLFSNRNE